MLGGFEDLSAEYFSEILTRRDHKQVDVYSVAVMDYADSPNNIRGATGLRKVDLSTSLGPLSLMVKVLGLARKREAQVWQFLKEAGRMPIPAVYHVELDSRLGNYGVITEFVGPLAEGETWSPEICRLVGQALARLHGRWWGKLDEAPDFLPMPQMPAESKAEPAARRFIDRLSEHARAVLHTAVPEVFSFMVSLLRMPPEFFSEPAELPRTVIHGALDRSEILFRPGRGHVEAVLIDWESARRGRCTEDLAGLLDSLAPEIRAAGGDPLVRAYTEALGEAGIRVNPDYLQEHIDRRRVMMAARDLPSMCRAYVERKEDSGQQHWCRWFLDRAGKDVAELRRLLRRLKGQA